MSHKVEIDLFGSKVSLETGKMAKQANGAVVVRSGDSVVLVTACIRKAEAGSGLFPAHGGLPRVHLRRRQVSRRLHQARRTACRRRKLSPAA